MSISATPVTASTSVYDQLFSLVDNVVECYRDDLEMHDLAAIAAMKCQAFVHISGPSGTHLYPMPEPIPDDAPIPYLFGRKRPSLIYKDNLDMLSTYFGRPDFFGYSHIFCVSDGTRVKRVSKSDAVETYAAELKRLHL